MERWSVGLKSIGTRPLTADERRRIKEVQRRFRMRAGKVALWCLVWAAVLPLMIEFRSVIVDFEGWALLGWFVGLLGVPVVTSPWTTDGLRRANRLGAGLRAGVVEILAPAYGADGRVEDSVVEVLPDSGFVLNEWGVPNERWRLAPIRALPGVERSAWLDYFDHDVPRDRSMARPMTEAERAEITGIRRHLLRRPLHGVIYFSFVALYAFLAGLYLDLANARRIAVLVALVPVVAIFALQRRALRFAWLLRTDLARGAVVVVSFGAASRASGAPESLELLPASRRIWSLNGAPAGWRILVGLPRS